MSRFRDCLHRATCRDYALNHCDGCNEWEWVFNKPTQPTVDAVPLENYKSMEQTVNKLAKAIADAVGVVRCKDCKHYWKNNPTEVAVCLASPRDDAYCSEGERREDENT